MKRKEKIQSDPNWIAIEYKEKVLTLYCEGMAVDDISGWTGLSRTEVNWIIDQISPYL